jgi:hypothetical protein
VVNKVNNYHDKLNASTNNEPFVLWESQPYSLISQTNRIMIKGNNVLARKIHEGRTFEF